MSWQQIKRNGRSFEVFLGDNNSTEISGLERAFQRQHQEHHE